ncbi:MAG: ABC-F family ATP-binding cassette domain-containing protein [Clostridia bacterium]|nr:ABC-F family ATP-binding cassette domain-containing protein [Clostridia bacterium]
MIVLSAENLSLSFGAKTLFEGVSFAADEYDRIGIIGSNGCGKTSLFKIILGDLDADTGRVYISKDKSIGILRQDEALGDFSGESGEASALEVMYRSFPELLRAESELAELESRLHSDASLAARYTSLNERFIADGGLEFRGRCASTLMKMGFDEESMNRPFSSLSGGQRTRLALSRELCREPDILMLDEPTNHLDTETLGWLESFLSSYKKCVLVISHDRYFLDKITNKTLCMEFGGAKLYNGSYTESMEKRKAEREIQERHYKNQQKEIARQEAYIANQRRWNRERNIIAAESRQKLLDKMERIEKPKEAPKAISFNFSSSIESGTEVLNIKNLCFSYNAGSELLGGLSCLVKKGDRLFISGPNGCGKSTLIKLLLGKLTATSGYIEVGYNVSVGYYDQENQNLDYENTVLDELWCAYPTMEEHKVRGALAGFRFFGDDVYKKVSELSGGERARLTLTKLLLSKMNLLILDEPTNHLDIDSREALERAIDEFEGTVIAVSHDRYFLSKLATRVLDLAAKPAVDVYVSHKGEAYDELCRDRERRAQITESCGEIRETASANKEQYLRTKQAQADRRRERARISRLESEAKKIEDELERITEEMSGDAAFDYVKLSELDTRKNELEERLLEIYEELEI